MYRLDVIKKMNLSNCNIIPYGSDTLFVREALLMSNRVGIMPEALYRYYVYPEVRDYNVGKYVIIRICPQLYFSDTLFS